jgi:lauroyl/myristoyl acyltransferase
VSSAAARVALRTRAWVIPSVVLRGPDDDTEIRPVIDTSLRDYAPTGDDAYDVPELTRLIMHSMEATIRRYPDQWFIFRRMWNRTSTAPARPGQLAEEV